jgi:ubiquinone/menaquinone biosynthesis C-methylase UbiE
MLNDLAREYLKKVKEYYDLGDFSLTSFGKTYRTMLSKYYNVLIPEGASVLEIGCGSGELLALIRAKTRVGVDISSKQGELAKNKFPEIEFYQQSGEELQMDRKFDYVILADTLNVSADVQQTMEQIRTVSSKETRLIINFQNNIWKPVVELATVLKLRRKHICNNWLSMSDVKNFLYLSDWQLIKCQGRILLPFRFFGLEKAINKYLAPFLTWICFTNFCIARPMFLAKHKSKPSVSIVIPARNEEGNIENAIKRIDGFAEDMEIIFVEGHSTDNTWEEIKRVQKKYREKKILIAQQKAKGKGDAVIEGFKIASKDVLMILDSDLTMPPEELPKFYQVLLEDKAEFVNGVRLVYPMDDAAMKFFNLCANKIFGLTFSWLLGQTIKDTLCGTKVFYRNDYLKIVANRHYFGNFDPFGDFDLLFGADKLNLKIVDVPIRYKNRQYGSTNINRWKEGCLLLRMVVLAAKKLKFV